MYEQCVMSKKCPPNKHFSNIDFRFLHSGVGETIPVGYLIMQLKDACGPRALWPKAVPKVTNFTLQTISGLQNLTKTTKFLNCLYHLATNP